MKVDIQQLMSVPSSERARYLSVVQFYSPSSFDTFPVLVNCHKAVASLTMDGRRAHKHYIILLCGPVIKHQGPKKDLCIKRSGKEHCNQARHTVYLAL